MMDSNEPPFSKAEREEARVRLQQLRNKNAPAPAPRPPSFAAGDPMLAKDEQARRDLKRAAFLEARIAATDKALAARQGQARDDHAKGVVKGKARSEFNRAGRGE